MWEHCYSLVLNLLSVYSLEEARDFLRCVSAFHVVLCFLIHRCCSLVLSTCQLALNGNGKWRWLMQISTLLAIPDGLIQLLTFVLVVLPCSKSFGTYLHEEGNQKLRQQAQQLMDAAAQLLKLAEGQGQATITQQQKEAAVSRHNHMLLCQ
jgi:hypothetical protein